MCLNPLDLKRPNYDFTDKTLSVYYAGQDSLVVPCGKCKECLEDYSREWSFRIMDEASKYKDNCFITLTYAENPESVSKRDLQLFMKRLRKKLEPLKIRYYFVGEYGDKKGRPHYHGIIFGWSPDDLVFLKETKRGELIYRSKTIEDCWTTNGTEISETTGKAERVSLGFSSVGQLTLNSARYTALYMQKLVKRPEGQAEPFAIMSRRPGLGNFVPDMLETDKVYHNGQYTKLPRYYLNIAEKQGFDLTHLKEVRQNKMQLYRKSADEIKKGQVKEKNFIVDKVFVK